MEMLTSASGRMEYSPSTSHDEKGPQTSNQSSSTIPTMNINAAASEVDPAGARSSKRTRVAEVTGTLRDGESAAPATGQPMPRREERQTHRGMFLRSSGRNGAYGTCPPPQQNKESVGATTAKVSVCRFFHTPDGCRFGHKCRFRHPGPSEPTTGANEVTPTHTGPVTGQPEPRREEPWMRRGRMFMRSSGRNGAYGVCAPPSRDVFYGRQPPQADDE